MKQGADWYSRYPALFLGGVQGLNAQQHAVFGVTLDLIYQYGGSVNNDPRWIAGWISDMGPARVRRVLDELVALGKLTIIGDQITQRKASQIARTKESLSRTLSEAGRAGGVASGAARRQKFENSEKNCGKKTRENPEESGGKPEDCDLFPEAILIENNDIGEALALSREDKTIEERGVREPIGSPKKPSPPTLNFDPVDPSPGDARPKKIKSAVAIHPEWVPSDRNIADALEKNFSEQEIADEADRFRDHHLSKGSTFKDWDAAWRTWLGNARRFAGGRVACAPYASGSGRSSSIASIVARRRTEGLV